MAAVYIVYIHNLQPSIHPMLIRNPFIKQFYPV